MKNIRSMVAVVLVFALCMGIGFWIAWHKPLWNDELFSFVSTRHLSYGDMLMGRIGEGNNTPLFYWMQKAFCQLVGYAPASDDWGGLAYGHAQIVLRVIPVFCMSLSITLVFFYFLRRYSWIAGILSLFVYATSYMLWVYWAEARPYALWVLLTTIQSLLLIRLTDKAMPDKGRGWIWLGVTHLCLSLTAVLSMGQIVASSVVLWFANERRWQRYLWLVVIPCAIALFYYAHAPRYAFWFNMTPEQLVRDNISRDKFHILLIFMFAAIAQVILQWKHKPAFLDMRELGQPLRYVYFTILALLSTVLVLWVFWVKATPNHGFTVANRYFIYLMPIGVIASTWASIALVRSLPRLYRYALPVTMAVFLGLLLMQRFLKIVPSALHSIMGQ